MFLCPIPENIDPRDPAAVKAQIRRNAEIYGKALGFDLVLSEIPYGIRFDVTARDPDGKQRMQIAQRFTVQMEAASNGIFITISMDFIGAFAILGQLTLERDSETAKMWAAQMEQFGFAHGACRML